MTDSILTDNYDVCFLCGSYIWIERHHIYGAANRKISDKYGLWVPLCHYCHNEPPIGVHHNAERDETLKRTAQIMFERTHTHDEFMKLIGKNYLDDDENS